MKGNKLKTVALYLFLLAVCLAFVLPMMFTVVSSLKNNTEIFSQPFSLPALYRIKNYVDAWIGANIGTYFINSIFISFAAVLVVGIIASMAAFSISRLDFKFNNFLSLFFLLGMMIPIQSILVPVSYLIGFFGLKNNLFALILLYVAFSLSFSVLVLVGFMKKINHSLIEAAVIDGANYWQIYWRIIMPLSVPALATISIFNFLSSWNNVIFPLLFINNNKLKPISLGLLNFNGERGSEYGPLMAAIVITVSIPLAIYIIFQEKVESGLAAGAVKE